MKPKLSFVFTAVTLVATAFSVAVAQNTSPYWSLAGNSNATASSKLGTTTAIPVRIFTNNAQRMTVTDVGRVGIGITDPINILTVKASGGVPASSWTNVSSQVFIGFAEGNNGEFNLGTATNTATQRSLIQGKRARGTLASPAVVQNNDYLASIIASGYDGSNFQNPAEVDFYVDGTPSAGHVPGRISLVTGTNISDRTERLKVGSTGNFNFNNTQLVLTQSNGNLSLGGGNFSMGSALKTIQFATPVASSAPMMTMFPSGTQNYNRMVIAHSPSYPDWGLQYLDTLDKFNFLSAGTPVLTADLGSQRVGIGTVSPTAKLDVLGQTRVFADDATGTDASAPFKIENSSGSGYYPGLTFYSGFTSTYAQIFGIGNNGILVYGASGYQPVAASAFNVNSDITLKKEITHIKTPKDYETYLNQIRTIDAITYRYKNEVATLGEKTSKNKVREELHVGFSAQSLPPTIQTKIPSGPSANAEMKLGYNLSDMAGLTLIGIKALDAKTATLAQNNEDLKKENAELKSKIDKQQAQIDAILDKLNDLQSAQQACCNAAGLQSGNRHPVNLSTASLDQNIPNPPANNSTRISYNIPNGSLKAELSITDNYGKKVKQIPLNNSGKGVLTIDTTGLAPGTYSYTLYVDGRLIETKSMVITGR